MEAVFCYVPPSNSGELYPTRCEQPTEMPPKQSERTQIECSALELCMICDTTGHRFIILLDVALGAFRIDVIDDLQGYTSLMAFIQFRFQGQRRVWQKKGAPVSPESPGGFGTLQRP